MLRPAVTGQIPVLSSVGSGGTALAAFHNALVAVDLAQYNLIRLSSVIPPGIAVDATGAAPRPNGLWGDRLYCVYAHRSATTPGERAWAGIGWVQRLDGGGGLFVEHDGPTEEAVTCSISTSLRDLVAEREDQFTLPERVLVGAVCETEPVCALVIAAYRTSPWVSAE